MALNITVKPGMVVRIGEVTVAIHERKSGAATTLMLSIKAPKEMRISRDVSYE